MRINARLDEDSESKIIHIQSVTGLTVTEIVKHSLNLFSQELESNAFTNNQRILKELGGIWDGPEDDSSHYKQHVLNYINEKYPDH